MEEFLEEEIYECLMLCKGDKALEPNSFNTGFIQECWHFMKKDKLIRFKNCMK